jgi:hypothetical protein
MFKSFIIVVLFVALMTAGVVSRPSEQSARSFLTGIPVATTSQPQNFGETVKTAFSKTGSKPEQLLPAGYEFRDRILWVEVAKDGKTIYTGVLSHWIKNDEGSANPTPSPSAQPVVAVK